MITNHYIRTFCLTLTMLIGISSMLKAQQNSILPQDLDNYVKKVLETFEVPGISLAVVKDGKVLLAKGYGIKKLGTNNAVGEHTLFPIASNTKAFTAAALAILVEEGKIKWDTPVINYLPWFRLADPYVTSEITVRDLLVHRSGIAPFAGDLLQFPPSNFSREEIVKKAKFLPLTTSFRSAYAYDNILYLAAGELIKNVTGMEWEDFVKTRILQPIGMTESISRTSLLKTLPDISASHARFDGTVKEVTHFFTYGVSDISNPAGGIASNAVDMSKWLITQLDSGRAANGKILFQPASTLQLWKGVTPMPTGKMPEYLKPAQMDYEMYALGFDTYNYRSEKVMEHGGKLDGFVSKVVMVPSQKLGIAVLTNQESGGACFSIINHIIDYVIKADKFDWISGYKIALDKYFENIRKTENSVTKARDSLSKPSLPLARYVNTYRDNWYGDVAITLENNHLVMNFTHNPGMIGDMEHWQYDTFVVRWRNREFKADAYASFSLNPDGNIDQIKMKAISPVTDPSYDFHDLLLKPVNISNK